MIFALSKNQIRSLNGPVVDASLTERSLEIRLKKIVGVSLFRRFMERADRDRVIRLPLLGKDDWQKSTLNLLGGVVYLNPSGAALSGQNFEEAVALVECEQSFFDLVADLNHAKKTYSNLIEAKRDNCKRRARNQDVQEILEVARSTGSRTILSDLRNHPLEKVRLAVAGNLGCGLKMLMEIVAAERDGNVAEQAAMTANRIYPGLFPHAKG